MRGIDMNRKCYNYHINHFQLVEFLDIHQYINFKKQQTGISPFLFREIKNPEEWKPHDDPKKESERLRELFPEFHDAVIHTPHFQEALKHIDSLNDQLDVTFNNEYLNEKEQRQLKDIDELMSKDAKPLVHSIKGYFLMKSPFNHPYSNVLLTRYLVISTQKPLNIPQGYELCSVDLIPSISLKILMGHIPDTSDLIIDREKYGLTSSSHNAFKLVNRGTVEKNLIEDTNQIESEIKKVFLIKNFHLSTDLSGFYAGTIFKDWLTQLQQVNKNEQDGILPQGIVTKTLEGTAIKLTNNPDTTGIPGENIFFIDYKKNATTSDYFQNKLLKMTHDTVLSRLPNGTSVPKLGFSNAFKFTSVLENPSLELTQDQFAQWVLERMYATHSNIREEMWKTYPETTYFIDENLKHSLRQKSNPIIDVTYDILRERDIDFTTGIPKRFPEPIPTDSYVNELQEAMGIADTKIATAPRWSFTRFKWKVIKQAFQAVHKVQMLSEAKTNKKAQAIGNIAESCDQLFSTLVNDIPVKERNITVLLQQIKEMQPLVSNKLIKSLEIENTMSQLASFAFMKILGFSMQNTFSYYSHFIVLNLPRIKRNIHQFSNCLQLVDFGEVALQYRIKSPSNDIHSLDWLSEYMLINQQFDEYSPPVYLSGDYFLENHYFNWIQDKLHSDSQSLLETLTMKYANTNDDSLAWIRIQLEQQLDNFISLLKYNPTVDITPNFLLTQYPILTDALFESYKNIGVY